MNYREKLNKLKKYAKMETEEDIKLFDKTLCELSEIQDPALLTELIDIFDDNCEFPEVMFNILHTIAIYPEEQYIEGVMKKVKDFKKYPEWFKILIYGILNDPEYYKILKQNIGIADKKLLKELLDLIYQESENHRTIVEELRAILKN